ncbi:MAG: protein-glutamate O-methyltransferase CheR [Myxococcales bacterium]
MSGPVAITKDEQATWSRYVFELCGIVLDETKGYLLETRLAPLLRETSSTSFSELYRKAKADPGPKMRQSIIDAITTNETSFFRDTSPFELLRHKLIPEAVDRYKKLNVRPVPLRIWSAACSTGQEAYSTAITLKETLGDLSGYDLRILGTDISDRAVAQASYGHFHRMDLERGLLPEQINRHFEKVGDRYKARDELRAMMTFRHLNLLQPLSVPGPFDLIFCRNVAIYFSEADRAKLFQRLGALLGPEGSLIIGATESIGALVPELGAAAAPEVGLLQAQGPRARRLDRLGAGAFAPHSASRACPSTCSPGDGVGPDAAALNRELVEGPGLEPCRSSLVARWGPAESPRSPRDQGRQEHLSG